MFSFLNNFHPKPILLQLGPIAIYWYGVFVVAGIIAGIIVTMRLAKIYGISKDEVFDLAFYLVIFGLLGGRLYAVLLFPGYYFRNPIEIFKVWHGGLAIHGAILAGLITLAVYTWQKKQSFWQWADIIAPALALGQAIGRWGNYFNQELFGKPTNLPWGIPINFFNRPAEYVNFEYFHPTFLYESLLNLVVFGALMGLHAYRLKKQESRSKNQGTTEKQETGLEKQNYWLRVTGYGLLNTPGTIALLYLIMYSLVRITMEFLRLDETPEFFGIRFPVLVSMVVIAAAVAGLIKRKQTKSS
jgi:phosphatidylglycerol:prolipoprotein diacylglycerol transferase